MTSRRHVALIVETSNQYARELLLGVHRFVTEHPDWSLYFAEHSRDETDHSWLEGWNGDGLLARIENRETAHLVRQMGLPTVDLSAARLAPEFPGVETDDNAIAAEAIGHFTDRGLRQFAFCGDAQFGWSVLRGRAFRQQLGERGLRAYEYAMTQSGRRSVHRQRLAGWLSSLPKPVGVLACYDIAGHEVLEACKLAGIRVPDEVAVVGVDNDQIIGNLTSPPLSSIEPDAAGAGFLASGLLDRMMAGEPIAPEQVLLAPLRVVTRRSSDMLSVDDLPIAQALRFIRERANEELTTEEVCRKVGLSRAALDRRLIRAIGRSAHAEILRVRLEQVKRLLINTDLTMQQICQRLSFSHPAYLSVAFKREVGETPSEYRKKRTRRRRDPRQLTHGPS